MTNCGENFLYEVRRYFNNHKRTGYVAIEVAMVAPWFVNFDELYLAALELNMVAHTAPGATDIIFERMV